MFYINLDLNELADLVDMGEVVEPELKKAAADLTAQTRAKIIELANTKLHSRRNMFIDALTHFQLDETTWVVNLDKSARWIDEGMNEHDMLQDLLKSPKAKRGKDGQKYLVVPFQHNKTKQNMTPAQQSLLATIKSEMRKVDDAPNKLALKTDGTPQLGLVRSMDIMSKPMNKRTNPLGRGAFGDVAQGPTGTPLLKGVRVYQQEIKKADGSKGVGRFVMTFRVASEKHKDQKPGNSSQPWKNRNPDKPKGQGRWHHPGVDATNLMEEGMRWALQEWESKIAPALLGRLVAKLS